MLRRLLQIAQHVRIMHSNVVMEVFAVTWGRGRMGAAQAPKRVARGRVASSRRPSAVQKTLFTLIVAVLVGLFVVPTENGSDLGVFSFC